MDLIKSKGLNLQDIWIKQWIKNLNYQKLLIHNKINDINELITKLEKENEESLKEYNKKLESIIKILMESKNKEEKYYNKRIQSLKLEIEYLEKNR